MLVPARSAALTESTSPWAVKAPAPTCTVAEASVVLSAALMVRSGARTTAGPLAYARPARTSSTRSAREDYGGTIRIGPTRRHIEQHRRVIHRRDVDRGRVGSAHVVGSAAVV